MRARSPNCPACGAGHSIPIQYGYPTPELAAQAERGELELGGCCIDQANPVWRCRKCGVAHGRLKRAVATAKAPTLAPRTKRVAASTRARRASS